MADDVEHTNISFDRLRNSRALTTSLAVSALTPKIRISNRQFGVLHMKATVQAQKVTAAAYVGREGEITLASAVLHHQGPPNDPITVHDFKRNFAHIGQHLVVSAAWLLNYSAFLFPTRLYTLVSSLSLGLEPGENLLNPFHFCVFLIHIV